MDERVEFRKTSCSYNGKLSLKTDESEVTEVSKRHEDVERKREHYHIIIFPRRPYNFIFKKREQVKVIVMEQLNSIVFHKSGPANK